MPCTDDTPMQRKLRDPKFKAPGLAARVVAILIFVTLWGGWNGISAQEPDPPLFSRIYLHGGGFLYGEILAWDMGKELLLRDRKGVEYRIPAETLRRVVHDRNYRTSPASFIRPAGWYGGGSFGLGFSEDSGLLLADLHGGWTRHRMLHAGISAGVYRSVTEGNEIFYPIALEWRGYWMESSFSPYTVIRAGTALASYLSESEWLPERRDYKPGFSFAALAGLRLGHVGPAHLALEAGYYRQDIRYDFHYDEQGGWIPPGGSVRRIQQRWLFRLVFGF